MTAIKAIKTYFEKDGGRKVDMNEMKNLSPTERRELGILACIELNEIFEENPSA